MDKLSFRHGTVGSAKTLNLLAVARNHERHLTVEKAIQGLFPLGRRIVRRQTCSTVCCADSVGSAAARPARAGVAADA